jgi:hypothetical protein
MNLFFLIYILHNIYSSCGGAGKADVTVKCVTFRVLRCKYSVGGEHQVATSA